jgi:hypothetical protein
MSAYVARSNRHLRTGLIGALLVAVSAVTAAKDAPTAYHFVKEIPIAGDTG